MSRRLSSFGSRLAAIGVAAAVVGAGALAVGTSPAGALTTATGTLTVTWADAQPGQSVPSAFGPGEMRFTLRAKDNSVRTLALTDAQRRDLLSAGGLRTLQGRTVTVQSGANARSATVGVRSITLAPTALAAAAVTGNKPYITLPCAFAGNTSRPHDVSYYNGMYANQSGRIDHYWRHVSYGAINVAGSTSAKWATLPRTLAGYASGTGYDLDAIMHDCTAAHDAEIDYSRGGSSPYAGINIALNDNVGCCAFGGAVGATLDGVNKSWPTTWLPPWAMNDVGVVEHEMGHSFGLPHSDNSDGDDDTYDNMWDVMSAAQAHGVRDSVYGLRGKHILADQKDLLGWIPTAKKYTAPRSSTATVELSPLEATNASGRRMIRIADPHQSDRSIVVELRQVGGDYDGALPGRGNGDRIVIISEVVRGRDSPAHVVDANHPAADLTDTEGVMWRTGETFTDSGTGARITIGKLTSTGVNVTVAVS